VSTQAAARPRRIDLNGIAYNALALVLAIGVAVLVGGLAIELSGHSAVTAFHSMLQYAACSQAGGDAGQPCTADTLIDILKRAVPYYLSALAVAIGFRMALFNIGVEGQYHLAAVLAAIAGASMHLPAPFQVTVLIVIAMATGAVWAGIAGVLKATRGVSEVISTIMLNYIASGLIAFILSSYLAGKVSTGSDNLSSATPTLSAASQMPGLNHPLHALGVLGNHADQVPGFLVIAAVVGTLFYFVVERSRFGFNLRASGINPFAAQAGGVSSKRMVVITMLISGALAGLVGLPELLGNAYTYSSEFPPNLGFNGIAVALLGRNKPIGIAFAALLWGFLESSSQILSLNGVPQEIYVLMQGSIVLAVVVAYEIVRRARVRRAERDVSRQAPGALGSAAQVPA
jgi:ABC-type uncharacterized transport system permease subunit